MSEFTLSRRVPEYVGRAPRPIAKHGGGAPRQATCPRTCMMCCERVRAMPRRSPDTTQSAPACFANKPGDGSAREQAASCQKVLGGFANVCYGYATKRYRSNCINWGIVPFTIDEGTPFDYQSGDCLFVPGIRAAIEAGRGGHPRQGYLRRRRRPRSAAARAAA